jgi:hypothetical protein
MMAFKSMKHFLSKICSCREVSDDRTYVHRDIVIPKHSATRSRFISEAVVSLGKEILARFTCRHSLSS